MFLIVGGSEDHNIARMIRAAERREADICVVYTDSVPSPQITWDLSSDDLIVNGKKIPVTGTSAFMRYDVFSKQDPDITAAIFETIKGWVSAHPEVGVLNRQNERTDVSKPRALIVAKHCGFETPVTTITDRFNVFAPKADFIAKPVQGGEYTKALSDMPEQADKPYFVQEKLNYPEMRLFRVGRHYFAFVIHSDVIDYRTNNNFDMQEVTPPKDLVQSMQKLTDQLGLNYAAADFKTDSKTGALKFLEINTMPMFTGYDAVAKGRLSDAMYLTMTEQARQGVKPKAVPQQGDKKISQ